MSTWQDKAHRLIADMCRTSYLQTNRKPNGRLYKRHRPYSVPLHAQELVECLRREDEVGAKQIFHLLACVPDAMRDAA